MNEQKVEEKAGQERSVGYDLDLMEMWYRIVENWKLIAIVTLITTMLAVVISVGVMKPVYKATAKLYVLSPGDSVINLSDLQIGSYLTSDYTEVFKTWEVNARVASDLQLNYSYDRLQGMLTISNPSDTRILYITVTSKDPSEAMLIANEYAEVARTYISDTMATEEPSILSSAELPTEPSGPNKRRNVALGFLLGFVASVGYVAVRFVFDDKIKSADDLRTYASMTALAIIPLSEAVSADAGRKAARRRTDRR